MQETNRETYSRLIRGLPHDWSNPVEGTYISVMQWRNPERPAVLLAQAVYQKIGGANETATVSTQYYICDEVSN